MDNAVVANPAVPALPLAEPAGLAERVKALPMRSKVSAALGVALIAAMMVGVTLWSGQPDYKVLYANLSDKDGGAIIAQLAQMNVPYRMSEGGAAILVPATQVHDLRLKLATAGLPKGSVTGYELMDSARFGQTQFQERLTAQRALEGELTRSINSMAAVESSRVHLALPNQNGFFREQQKPSASVLLTFHAGRSLDRAQIGGIVHLVASSVPEMDPKAVSVLDQTGTLLTETADAKQAGLDAQQLAYVNRIETGYGRRIVELLEPIVGRDNLRATVAADVDFAQSEATSEQFHPNQGADASIAVRSQQTSEQSGTTPQVPSGIPGATTNQPPLAATAPLTGASQPLQTAQGGSAGATTNRREATTNYEVDKTVRVTRNASGTIRRLNAAVVVNDRTTVDNKGKTVPMPISPEELEKLTALVRESIGFKQERGDSVKVINAPFRVEPVTTIEVQWWREPMLLEIARTAALPTGLVLVALVIFFGMIRPTLKAALPAPPPPAPEPGATLDAVVDDEQTLDDVPALPAPDGINKLENARTLARENPVAVANIMRSWVNGEAA